MTEYNLRYKTVTNALTKQEMGNWETPVLLRRERSLLSFCYLFVIMKSIHSSNWVVNGE